MSIQCDPRVNMWVSVWVHAAIQWYQGHIDILWMISSGRHRVYKNIVDSVSQQGYQGHSFIMFPGRNNVNFSLKWVE